MSAPFQFGLAPTAAPAAAAPAGANEEDETLVNILIGFANTLDADDSLSSHPIFSLAGSSDSSNNNSFSSPAPSSPFTSTSNFKSRKSGGGKSSIRVGKSKSSHLSSDERPPPVPVYTLVRQLGKRGYGDGEFQKPAFLALSNGKLYSTDIFLHRIQVFDVSSNDGSSSSKDSTSANGCKFLKVLGKQGKGPGEFCDPKGITVADGLVYVADHGNNRIQVFKDNSELEFVREFGKMGDGDGEFNDPINVAVADGRIYVVDQRNRRVQIFDTQPPSYRYIGQFGTKGKKPSEFELIHSITVSNGLVYVGDVIHHRVSIFDAKSLQFVRLLDTECAGRLFTPVCVTIASGRIYITDHFCDCLYVFDEAKGTLLTTFGSSKDLLAPSGVVVTNDTKTIFVADMNNARIQEFHVSTEAQ